MGLKGLNKPVLLHSMRHDMCKLTPEQCAWKARKWVNWYTADWDYGRTTVYFIVGFIILFGIFKLLSELSARPGLRNIVLANPITRRLLAWYRYLAYRSYYVNAFGWYSPSCGVMIIGAVGFAFCTILMLAATPYYWPNQKKPEISYGNSPPIATRAGWMAVGLLPFIVAFAAKWNFITLITGISHERLQVYHRWLAYACFVLALVHTFPFIVYRRWKGDLKEQVDTTIWYWTGIATLIPQAWLTFASAGPLRNKFYEFFKIMHHIASILFVVFFFLHCNFRLTSWDYFIVTAVIYGASLVISFTKSLFYTGIHHATMSFLTGDGILVEIPTNKLRWTPGQHLFIRFFTKDLHAYTSHPFTICSTPATDKDAQSLVKFYIRPHGGITGRLKAMAEKQMGSLPVQLEGPYGGLQRSLSGFDTAMIIAGGSGGTIIMPILEDLFKDQGKRLESTMGRTGPRDVNVVWCIRDRDTLSWFSSEFTRLRAASLKSGGNLKISIYVTSGPQSHMNGSETSSISLAPAPLPEEKEIGIKTGEKLEVPLKPSNAPDMMDGIVIHSTESRPNVRDMVQVASLGARSMAVAVCGPSSLIHDVQNAVATLEMNLVRGRTAGSLNEVYLHTEHFGW